MIVKPVIVGRTSAALPVCPVDQVNAAVEQIESIIGVDRVFFDSNNRRLLIEYDLLKNSYPIFNAILIKNGIYLKSNIKFKLLSIWYDYLDSTARDNALAPPASCCNKPPRSL